MTSTPLRKIIRLSGRVIFLFLLVGFSTVKAQQFYFDNYGVKQGLAQSTVYSIIQDSEDNYWLGTKAGASLFDGVTFVNFTAEDGLSEGGVRAIFEDRDGNIWFGHDGGRISRYRNGAFERYEQALFNFNSNITTILADTLGHVWFGSQETGAAVIPNPNAPIKSIKHERYLGRRLSDRIFSSHLGQDGSLYFVTDPVVKEYYPDSLSFDNLVLRGMPRYFATTCMLEDTRNDIWFGTYHGGLFRYVKEKDDTRMYDLIKMGMTSNWVSTLFEDSDGNLWIGTWGGGVGRLDSLDNLTVFDSRNGLAGEKIWDIIEDKEGNIVLGTNEHGIAAFKGDYFVTWFEEDGLSNSQVFAVEQDRRGRVWLGTNAGISIIKNIESGEVQDFSDLKGERIRYISEDRSGNMWIAADGEGVFTYTRSGQLRFEPMINSNIPLGQVTGLEVDSDNNLWLGTLDGLIYYEIDHQKISRLAQVSGLLGSEISAVYPDSKGRIWVGIEGKGINVIVGSEFKTADIGMAVTPTVFAEDRSGNIWIGTEGRGLIAYNFEEERVIDQLTVQDGLNANLVNLLISDNENRLYIGTNNGLNKLDLNDSSLIGFTPKSGFVGIETKHNATCLDREGKVWFGTGVGVTRYDPDLAPRDIIEPLTHITGLMVNYEPYPMEQDMELSYRQNSLIFDYKSITLNPDAITYEIKLEGIDSDWRPPGKQMQVNYPALRPKKYTFFVRARSSKGAVNDPPISLRFQIDPPFYLTTWFILSMVALMGFIIFAYIKVRERALKKENRILEEKVQHRTAEVVAQKEELAQKNKDITDSIRYAKRIQFAILPPASPFPETFILFKPKDIVSGDFYWFAEVGEKEFIAAVDCTGHGVPGALMSMIGHSSLNKIVNQYGETDPGKILTQLNSEVVHTLLHSREHSEVVDGMDLSLIAFDKADNTVEFAGAYNPMYLVRDMELEITKADQQPIGRSEGTELKVFNTRKVQVQKGDMVYLFSDGYQDQFGGEKQKKFKPKNMRELMVKISNQPVEKQREVLNKTIEDWKGGVEQIDDILIIGRRF